MAMNMFFYLIGIYILMISNTYSVAEPISDKLQLDQQKSNLTKLRNELQKSLDATNILVENYTKQAVHEVNSKIKVGIPGIQMGGLEPISMNNLQSIIGINNSNDLKLTINTFTMNGLSGLKLVEVDTSILLMRSIVRLIASTITIEGSYTLSGRIEPFPAEQIERSGMFKAQLFNLSINASSAMYISKSTTLICRKFVSIEKPGNVIAEFQNLAGKNVDQKMEKEIGNQILLHAVDSVMLPYTKALTDQINKNINQIDLNSTLGGKVKILEVYTKALATNNAITSGLITDALRTGIDREFVLPDFRKDFRRKVLFMWVKGSTGMYNGKITGLDTVEIEVGDFEATTLAGQIIVANITLEYLDITYQVTAKYMGIGPQGTATLHIDGVYAECVMEGGLLGTELKKFGFTGFGPDRVSFNGFGGMMDSIYSYYSEVLIKLVRTQLVYTLETQLRSTLAALFKETDIFDQIFKNDDTLFGF